MDQNLILLVTSQHTLLFSGALKTHGKEVSVSKIDQCIGQLTCFAAALPRGNGTGFLVACMCMRNRQPARFVPPVYEGKSTQESLTWLARCAINRLTWRIECLEPQTSSMLL